MSQTITAVIINLLATVLPLIGVQVGSDALTTTVQAIIAIGTGLWIWYQRTKLRHLGSGERSDVNLAGIRK